MTLLADTATRDARRALLHLPHTAPLAAYAAGLRDDPALLVPDFDPLDGGTEARVLFLLEKPGPSIQPGGFVSRDNPTPTGSALRAFMAEAGLPREQTVLWNLVPWWNGTTRITAAERTAGLRALLGLLPLLPRLDTAVLVGRTAAAARPHLPHLRVLASAHPSPQVRAAFPGLWRAIPAAWRQAASPRPVSPPSCDGTIAAPVR